MSKWGKASVPTVPNLGVFGKFGMGVPEHVLPYPNTCI